MVSKKILVVEDRWRWHEIWRLELRSKAILISAFSIEEAEKQFSANPDLSAIVIDACVPGNEPTTLHLVQKLRKIFTGPMIGISSHDGYRQQLIEAGCDHESTKNQLSVKLFEVLGLEPAG
jgi:CheY-like chemotaxis protein